MNVTPKFKCLVKNFQVKFVSIIARYCGASAIFYLLQTFHLTNANMSLIHKSVVHNNTKLTKEYGYYIKTFCSQLKLL